MSRGMLTEEIKALAKDMLGIEDFTVVHLRLIPYLIDCSINSRQIAIVAITPPEREVLKEFKNLELLSTPASNLNLTKKFWDGATQLLWLAYANK